jgi:hypothetical protein
VFQRHMSYREQRHILGEARRPLLVRLLPAVISRACALSWILAAVVVVAGCATDGSGGTGRDPQDFRCRIAKSDGTCESLPAGCPVTLSPPSAPEEPHCPVGAELIPIADDNCAEKRICID